MNDTTSGLSLDFQNVTGNMPTAITDLKNDILKNESPALQKSARQMEANLAQQGVSGGQAATLLNRGVGEMGNTAEQNIDTLIASQASQQQAQQANQLSQQEAQKAAYQSSLGETTNSFLNNTTTAGMTSVAGQQTNLSAAQQAEAATQAAADAQAAQQAQLTNTATSGTVSPATSPLTQSQNSVVSVPTGTGQYSAATNDYLSTAKSQMQERINQLQAQYTTDQTADGVDKSQLPAQAAKLAELRRQLASYG